MRLTSPRLSSWTSSSPSRYLPPIPAPYTGGYAPGTFSIGYASSTSINNYAPVLALGATAPVTNNLFQYSWQPRFVDSEPWLPDAWDAPFIYEDRRYLFYANTTVSRTPIGGYEPYGFNSAAGLLTAPAQAIPRLVLRQQVTTPASDGILAVNASSGGNPAVVQRYLSQQTTIKAGLATPVAISYQGQVISAAGSVAPAAAADGQGA